MTKENIIADIKQRIKDEQRKHKNLDWYEIAARKIYSAHIAKEETLEIKKNTCGYVGCENPHEYTYKGCNNCEFNKNK